MTFVPLILVLVGLQQHELATFVEQARPDQPAGGLVFDAGQALLGVPYEAHTLESEDEEQLTIDFSGFDCVTLVETCMAAARCVASDDPELNGFAEQLQLIRYRKGEIDGYGSRLHYVTAWLLDAKSKGVLEDLTASLGGIVDSDPVNFMSEHPQLYAKMADPTIYRQIVAMEDWVNETRRYYIPTPRVAAVEAKLLPGDIIALTTEVKGLDVSHLGVVARIGDRAHLLHASSKMGQVTISEQSLSQYVEATSRVTGIMVFRPKDPVK